MKAYLEATQIVNYLHPKIHALAVSLSKGCHTDYQIAQKCFEYVRDKIQHSGDYKAPITTYKASDVLIHKTGWCYAKSHLLAGLLRANHIPSGFCYQRLSCDEYTKESYCLHGLNSIYLKDFGWYRVDARGNKDGVNAQFTPPHEALAFVLEPHEFDLNDNLSKPLETVITALKENSSYSQMIQNFPDIKTKVKNKF